MSTKIYLDNLAAGTMEHELIGLFSAYGNVVDVNIAVDRRSPEPRGFGFVTMVTSDGARAAIQALNGKTMGTSLLTASEACPNEERASPSNGRRAPRRRASQLF